MLLRFGFGALGSLALAGLVFAAPACSSSDSTTPAGPTPDGGTATPGDGATQQPQTDGGTDAGGQAITEAKAGSWTWIPFPDSACGDGSPTGIAVNLGTSKRLVIYLEGGGACWNEETCYSLKSATFVTTGYGESDFKTAITTKTGSSLDRTVTDNPFKDDNMVFVPYCTGDIHSGDKEIQYPGAPTMTHHVGRRNVDAYLKRLVPTFSDASRVVLTGSSAGGFGAAVNYERVRKAFGGTLRVDMVDDSGPPFPNADIGSYADWATSWDLNAAYPAGCTACATDVTALLPYYARTYTDARFALLSYDQDGTIRQFFQTPTAAAFQTELNGVIATQIDPSSNMKAFEVSGNLHTMLYKLSISSGTPTVASFLTDMESDSATWATVKTAQP